MRLHNDSWRWEGVPFLILAGKGLATTATEVIVSFKRPPVMMLARGKTNYVRFRLGPAVEIALGARVKRPGAKLVSELIKLHVTHFRPADERSPSERLLGDAM